MVRLATSTSATALVRPDASHRDRLDEFARFARPHPEEERAMYDPAGRAASPWCGTSSVRERVGSEDGYRAGAARDARDAPDASAASDAAASPAAPVPDPFDDADALEELGEQIVTLAAHLHAGDQRLLAMIAEFDRRRGWELGGHRSCAHWVALWTGVDLGAARERVRAARVLAGLPETSAAMARGELSFSAVRALTRVATPENEEDLLELAKECTTAQLEKVVRAWKRGSRKDEAALERERHESRTLSVFPDDDGMYRVRGRLTAEVGALLMRAIEAASDALYREQTPEARRSPDSRTAATRRRADAVGLLAERALSAGFGASGSAPVSGTRAERYQVMLHVEDRTLEADGEPGRSELEDGTRVSAETSRRLSCDAAVVRVTRARDGGGGVDCGCCDDDRRDSRRGSGTGGATWPKRASVLDVGRRTRTIPPALRRALNVRDQGCRFPGCGLRFCDAHHVRHWADGGETSLENCVLLCWHHHLLVHEGGWQMRWWGEGRPVFFDPRGGTHFEGRWQPPELPERPVEKLIAESGVDPDAGTVGPRWKREADIPDEVLFRALEAAAPASPGMSS